MTILMFAVFMSMHLEANAAKNVVLVEPGPISLPTGRTYSLDQVKKAIIAGASRHQWNVESEKPGVVRIILDRHSGREVLVMDVVYDDKNYSVKYVRSVGLDYEKGTPAAYTANPNSNTISVNTIDHQMTNIHSSYARWMKGLTDAINTELRSTK
ncbi:MAG: hypothetical protein ACXWJD_02860 [Burkholderiaceae bacterium]